MATKTLIAFVEWLQKLPKRESLNIAQLTAELMPGCHIDIMSNNVTDVFMSWITEQAKNPLKSMGTALSLKEIVNFAVMDGITDSEQWKEQSKNIELVIEDMKAKGYSEKEYASLEAHLQSLQFKSAQSQKMKMSWLKLCQDHFTHDAIKQK